VNERLKCVDGVNHTMFPGPWTDNDRQDAPLDGLIVVEAGVMLSAPNAGRLLADFGATVIKIEHPEFGDHSRRFGPQKDGVGLWWKHLNRNKIAVTLDLNSEAGQRVFHDLVGEADVLMENFRQGKEET